MRRDAFDCGARAPRGGPIAEVPELAVTFPSAAPSTVFDRAHNLFRRFSEGDGELTLVDAPSPSLREGVALHRLPWETHPGRTERVRLLTWQHRAHRNDENMPAIVLRAGESWCTANLSWRRGARLRFEALSIEADRPATLRVLDAAVEASFPSSLQCVGADRFAARRGIGCRVFSRRKRRDGHRRAPDPRSRRER